MAEYIELIDKYRIVQSKDTDYNPPTYDWVDNTGEIVRCEDCKHWEADWTPRGVSDGRHYCAPLDLFPSADWFCADGERREES